MVGQLRWALAAIDPEDPVSCHHACCYRVGWLLGLDSNQQPSG